ncbi:unnamed protein product [Microthlaspi erraticum]|uniref:Uncharacterized protein n=1 Tax=Microthlaspi erraticum TaxID=1685480 RepID=A0A6D2JXE1_9BRAS|nr:unnamed protein product [Microthlaspi erraticum]
MVEGESSNARETRLKMQADLKKMDQRMEESDAEGYVYSEEQSERRNVRTESEEEGEEVNQLVDEDDQEGNQDEPMEEAEEEQEEDELPMYQEHYMLSSPWTLWRLSTHMMTP